MAILVLCPHCHVHAKATERSCPHCGGRLRSADGSLPRAAYAVALGLSVAATACAEEVQPAYGVPAVANGSTSGQGGMNAGSGGSDAGGANAGGANVGGANAGGANAGGANAGGMSAGGANAGGTGGAEPMPAYGIAGSSSQ